MRYTEFALTESSDWQALDQLLQRQHLEVYVKPQGHRVRVQARDLEDLYMDRDGGGTGGQISIEFWLDTPHDWDIIDQSHDNGEDDHWLSDHDVTDRADLIADDIRRYYGDNWDDIDGELHGSWAADPDPLLEDPASAEALPLRGYENLYVENSHQGPILYGIDLEWHGESGLLGWFDFEANLATGEFDITGRRANSNRGGGFETDGELEQWIESCIEDAQREYGDNWDDIASELHGSWAADDTTDESSPGTDIDQDTAIKNIDSGHLQKAIEAIAQLVHDRQMAYGLAQRSTLEKELAQRFRTRYAGVAADALKAEQGQLTVGQLGLALYRYVYQHQAGHPMGGSRSHNPLLRDFLENDVHVAVDDQGGLHPEESSWGVDH